MVSDKYLHSVDAIGGWHLSSSKWADAAVAFELLALHWIETDDVHIDDRERRDSDGIIKLLGQVSVLVYEGERILKQCRTFLSDSSIRANLQEHYDVLSKMYAVLTSLQSKLLERVIPR